MLRKDRVRRVGQLHQMNQGALDRSRRALEQVPETVESVHETVEQGHRALPVNPGIDPPSFARNRR